MEASGCAGSSVKQKLLRRENERVSTQISKRAERQDMVEVEETPDFFKVQFSELQQQIESKLNNISGSDEESKSSHIEELLLELNSLQKLLTDSTHFLSQFSIKVAQGTITNLRNDIIDKKSQCVPKKKFGFKTKSTKPTGDGVDHGKSVNIGRSPQKTKLNVFLETNTNSVIVRDVEDSTITKYQDEISSKDVTLSNLFRCKVKLQGSASAVHIHNIRDCEICIGPVKGSVLIEDCIGCVIVAACQQMRIHKTYRTNFFIHVTSRAIIEECSDVKFASFAWSYETLEQDFGTSGLDRGSNNWNLVEDFNWLVPGVHSPNWSILTDDEQN